jgi:hypothetical protein
LREDWRRPPHGCVAQPHVKLSPRQSTWRRQPNQKKRRASFHSPAPAATGPQCRRGVVVQGDDSATVQRTLRRWVVVATVAGTAAVATHLLTLLLLPQLLLLVGVACGRAGVAHTVALRNRRLNSARGNLQGAASRTKKKMRASFYSPAPAATEPQCRRGAVVQGDDSATSHRALRRWIVVATVAGTAAVAKPSLTLLPRLPLQLLVSVACGRAGVAHTAALRNRTLNSARGNLHGAASRTKKKMRASFYSPAPAENGPQCRRGVGVQGDDFATSPATLDDLGVTWG